MSDCKKQQQQVIAQQRIGLVKASIQQMILLLPCPVIKDTVSFPTTGQFSNLGPLASTTRNTLKQFSNVEYLIKQIQEGTVIMTYKVSFDNYLKSQVDLMRASVLSSQACPFAYSGYMNGESTISTGGLSTKQQWAVEMVMSRYAMCSIYHAGAYSNLQFIFRETGKSFEKGYKSDSKIITNLQIAFKYFNQGYQPLRRLADVYDTLLMLIPKNSQLLNQHIELRKQMFIVLQSLVGVNLAYLKIQKYRLMAEYRSCKQLAWSVFNLIKDLRMIMAKTQLMDQVHPDIKIFMDIGELFFQAYALYFLLQEHEDMKNKQQYGFIKKQFQQMIVQNVVVCEQFQMLFKRINSYPHRQNYDNVQFAYGIVETMLKQVQRKKYAYGINIHENKQLKPPTLTEIVNTRIASRKIWDSINQF